MDKQGQRVRLYDAHMEVAKAADRLRNALEYLEDVPGTAGLRANLTAERARVGRLLAKFEALQ